MSQKVPDKIINHLISRYILLPSLESCLIDTNVATRKDKGSKYAYDATKKAINSFSNEQEVYILKLDITKYFYNIDHEILFDFLKNKGNIERE